MALERFGAVGDVAVVRPAAMGVRCTESDVVDLATELINNRTITSLDLSNANVSVEAAGHLARCLGKSGQTAIQHVCLANCGLRPEALALVARAVAENDKIEAIELQGNPLRDDGAVSLAHLLATSPSLRTADFSECKIGPQGAQALAAALEVNTRLTLLSLNNNKLRAAGTAHICNGLKKNHSIRILNLGGNSISADGGMAVAELLKENNTIETFNLARNYLSAAAPYLASALAQRSRPMRLLDLSHNHVDGDICKALAQVLEGHRVAIACLSLEGNNIGDSGMVAMFHAVKGTGIQFLDLSETGLTVHSGVVVADLIAACPQLNSVQLDGNTLGDDACVEVAVAMGKSATLASLNLERTGLGPRGAVALADAIAAQRRLRSLNVADNAGVRVQEVLCLCKALRQLTTLEEVDFSSLALDESETLLEHLVTLFDNNASLDAVMLEHTPVGAALPNGVLSADTAAALRGGTALHNKSGGGAASRSGVVAVAASSASVAAASFSSARGGLTSGASAASTALTTKALIKRSQHVFKPAWALTIPLDAPAPSPDEAEDGARVPLVPAPTSLHDPLYPGYGRGRFSSGSLVQSANDPLPYNVAVTRGTRRPFIPTADGASLLMAPPRKTPKASPYGLHVLEGNPGQLPVTDDQLRRKFAELDADGHGFLDRSEFRKLYLSFQSYGLPVTEREIDMQFAKYTSDDGKVSYDEFCIFMLKLAQR